MEPCSAATEAQNPPTEKTAGYRTEYELWSGLKAHEPSSEE
jgi:hypothetical protein